MTDQRNFLPILTQLIFLIILLSLQTLALAEVTARLDRSSVYEGESVTLHISSDGPTSVQPDITELEKDFIIAGNSTSSQYSFINGQQSRSINWTILLEPKNKGTITIPPIKVGSETTPELELTIEAFPEELAASLADHLFLEAIMDVDRPIYVQQQIPYTIKFYYTDEIDNGDLNAPEIENAVMEKLGKDKRYREVRNNKPYNVIERQYVISAEKSGVLEIPAATFKGHASTPYPEADPEEYETLRNHGFFNIPSFSRHHSRIDRPVQTASKAYTIEVQPRPGKPTEHWLPAEQLKLVDSWASNPPRMKTGEPVTRTIAIQTKGLTGSQLPVLEIAEPQGSRIYPESPEIKSQTDGQTVYGSSTQKYTYIANQAGILTVPEISLEWWDIRENKLKTATLPKWEINVGKGTASQVQTPTKKSDPNQAPTTSTEENDNEPIKSNFFTRDLLIALFIGLFVIAGVFLINRRNRNSPAITPNTKIPDQSMLLSELEKDCTENNPENATRHLLQLAETLWNKNPPQTLGELASQVKDGKQSILDLDKHLYGKSESAWNGSQLLAVIKQGLRKKDTSENSDGDILKPLYPQYR